MSLHAFESVMGGGLQHLAFAMLLLPERCLIAGLDETKINKVQIRNGNAVKKAFLKTLTLIERRRFRYVSSWVIHVVGHGCPNWLLGCGSTNSDHHGTERLA